MINDTLFFIRSNLYRLHSMVIFIIICSILALPASGKTVSVDPAKQFQTFEGWGTSLCWWAVSAGGWSDANRKQLVGAIVDPDTGLGYTCFRYNIGGGDNPSHTHLQTGRAVPGFKPTESGDYDWNADKNQRAILLDLAAREKNCIFEAFSNSPPWWMTISGCASGNTNGTDNLKPEKFSAFADYLTDVVKYYKEQHGIRFRTVEPFNEPSSGYWKTSGGQEGCGFKSRQSEMIKILGRKLVDKKLFPEVTVSASDETSLAHTVTSVKNYDDSALSYLSQINSHSYDGWGSRRAVDSISRKLNKNLWQSESGPLSKKDQSDITMWMSHVIIQDLRVMRANAWIDWQVGDNSPNWRSIELRTADQKFVYTKRFYLHAAFSRFIRPGSRIIYSSDTNSLAALVPSTGKLVVVMRNDAAAKSDYTIELPQNHAVKDTAQVYQFTLPGSLRKLDNVMVSAGKATVSAPAQSVTTVLFSESATAARPSTNRCVRSVPIKVNKNSLEFTLPPGTRYTVRMYGSNGRVVFKRQGTSNSSTQRIAIAACSLAPGVYVTEVVAANGRINIVVPVAMR